MVNRPTDKKQSKTAVPRAASKAKNYKQLLELELRELINKKKKKRIQEEIFKRSYLLSNFTSNSTLQSSAIVILTFRANTAREIW